MLYLEMEHLLKAMDTLMKESGATTYLMDQALKNLQMEMFTKDSL